MLRKPISIFFLLMVGFVMLPVGAGAQMTVTYVPLYTAASGLTPGTLIQSSDGNFYAVTAYDDTDGNYGSILRITQSGQASTLHTFQNVEDGAYPVAIYEDDTSGTPRLVGITANGVLFSIDGSGQFSVISSAGFQGIESLIPGPGGYFGVYNGGTNQCSPGCQSVFSVTPSGTFTSLETFDGVSLYDLLLASDGNYYGTTNATTGETTNPATIFWSDFNSYSLGGCCDYAPSLTAEGSDGALYGVTVNSSNEQYFYRFVAPNQLTAVYSFTGSEVLPQFLAGDGNFYGVYGDTTATVSQLTRTGQYTQIANISGLPGGVAFLTQADDGNFYIASNTTFGKLAFDPPLQAPISMSFNEPAVDLGKSATLTWKVGNGFSATLQQCYANVASGTAGSGAWTGLQSGTVSNGAYTGTATITPTAKGTYTYALTCGGSESGFASLNAGGAQIATTTSVTAPSPVTLGTLVTLGVTISSQPSVGPPTGNVAFSSGGLSLGTVNLSNGVASLNVTAQGIPTGTYRVTASYSGDSNYQPSVGTTTVTVLGYGTSTSLSASSGQQLTQGQSTTLSANVVRSSVSGTPSGNVTFSYGSTVLGTAKLVNGTASFAAATNGSIPPGTYAVTAKYDGDATDQTSVSAPVNVTVIAATSTSLSVSPMTVPKNSAVMLTSVVKRKYDAGVPTGSVTFSVGSYFLGTQALDGTGMAVVNASSVGIAAGTYPVTATYSGDASNAASSSTVDVKVE